MRNLRIYSLVLGSLFAPWVVLAQPTGRVQEGSAVSDDVSPELVMRVRAVAEQQPGFVAMTQRGRVVFIGVDAVRVKPDKEPAPGAMRASVFRATHYRYADNVTVYSVVDLAREAVLSVAEAKNVPTPLSEEEVKEATELALANEEVRRALGDQIGKVKVEALGLYSTDPKDPVFGRRTMSLFFRVGDLYIANLDVVVDLTNRKVIVTRVRQQRHGEPPQ